VASVASDRLIVDETDRVDRHVTVLNGYRPTHASTPTSSTVVLSVFTILAIAAMGLAVTQRQVLDRNITIGDLEDTPHTTAADRDVLSPTVNRQIAIDFNWLGV
jgi:hypothetical protein